MSTSSTPAASASDRLMRVGGILALAAGAGLILGLVLEYLVIYRSLSGVLGGLVIAALLIVGGVLALRGLTKAAPWVILGGVVLSLLWFGFGGSGLVSLFPFPWQAVSGFADSIEYAGVVETLVWLVTDICLWLGPAAFIVALMGFIKAPRTQRTSATTGARVMTGVAVPDAEGNVPEGWYPDPDGKPSERYFDGQSWTDRSRPMTAATAPLLAGAGAKPTVTPTGEPISPKSRAAAAILCWFLGIIGIHRFYVGKVGTGIAQIFTLGGLGIWTLIDFVWILTGTWKDKDERVLANW